MVGRELQKASIEGALDPGELNAFYLMVVGMFVFFMQAGFAMLEAGSVRAKNTKNILLKNLLDACIGALIWWAWGYSVAYSTPKDVEGNDPNGFIGTAGTAEGTYRENKYFFSAWMTGEYEDPTGYEFAYWFFQYCFAAAAATIVSGAVAERAQLGAYLFYTIVITGWIYPVVVHWVWCTGGWLSVFTSEAEDVIQGGCIDYAGSGVVHMTGGVAAFWGAAIIGPRIGRYDENGKVLPIPGHSTVLAVLGTFILWLGWYGFNPGSTLGLTGASYGKNMARVVVTTTLSAASGGLTTVLFNKFFISKCWDVGAVCNGILAGLVSITAACACVTPWYAFVIGIIGSFVYTAASTTMSTVLMVDDPLDAFAVHGACGFWGVLAAAFFADPVYAPGFIASLAEQDCAFNATDIVDACDDDFCGLFFGGTKLIPATATALGCEIAWVSFWAITMFFGLKVTGFLRVPADVESSGMDVSKHGGAAYSDIYSTTK